jgi:HD superfamily phosphohydrolase
MKSIIDPVHQFISIPEGIINDLVDHPYVQRLRRISQLGMTHFVYPGATHSRFHHVLGALHLMKRAIDNLRIKGISISDEEEEATLIAILLHDIGHGPMSHALEFEILDQHHESITLKYMDELNLQFKGKLDLSIEIFTGKYNRKFFKQLVSSQIDMDRMDYLVRDSYYTGVAEGIIGIERILLMLNVVDDLLVVEENGLLSIERFLLARRLMYMQVYLHKTVISAESMMKLFVKYFKKNIGLSPKSQKESPLKAFIINTQNKTDITSEILEKFASLDDSDILQSLKESVDQDNFALSFLSKSLLNRDLFRCHLTNEPINSDRLSNLRLKIASSLNLEKDSVDITDFYGKTSIRSYDNSQNDIRIFCKNGEIRSLSSFDEIILDMNITSKYYLCIPKNILLY